MSSWDLAQELLRRWPATRAAQSGRGPRVQTGRARDSQIDLAGVERFQRAEGFRDQQRRVDRKHHPARPDPYPPRRPGHLTNDHGRRGRGRSTQVVVLGDPVTVEAETLGVLGQIHGLS